jgi:hypothetical protein
LAPSIALALATPSSSIERAVFRLSAAMRSALASAVLARVSIASTEALLAAANCSGVLNMVNLLEKVGAQHNMCNG